MAIQDNDVKALRLRQMKNCLVRTSVELTRAMKFGDKLANVKLVNHLAQIVLTDELFDENSTWSDNLTDDQWNSIYLKMKGLCLNKWLDTESSMVVGRPIIIGIWIVGDQSYVS